jgi:hypothetical protein
MHGWSSSASGWSNTDVPRCPRRPPQLPRGCVDTPDPRCWIDDAVSGRLEGIEDPRRRLATLIHAHVEVMLRDRDLHGTMLVDLRALKQPGRTEVIALVVLDEVTAAQDAGVITSDHSAYDLSLALLNLLNWTIFWYQENAERTPE